MVLSYNMTGITGVKESQSLLCDLWTITILLLLLDFQVGQLIHLQSFTLFDAMSAIEIMDPKMDTGMLLEEDEKNHKDDTAFNVERILEPRELLWIMDRLLSCEVKER